LYDGGIIICDLNTSITIIDSNITFAINDPR
jgi:hypothetical protein